MKGKNVIAMARTGSGKTAAFLIPMLERLKCRVPKTGARALIFSPTRELAMQTMKFTKEVSLYSTFLYKLQINLFNLLKKLIRMKS